MRDGKYFASVDASALSDGSSVGERILDELDSMKIRGTADRLVLQVLGESLVYANGLASDVYGDVDEDAQEFDFWGDEEGEG